MAEYLEGCLYSVFGAIPFDPTFFIIFAISCIIIFFGFILVERVRTFLITLFSVLALFIPLSIVYISSVDSKSVEFKIKVDDQEIIGKVLVFKKRDHLGDTTFGEWTLPENNTKKE